MDKYEGEVAQDASLVRPKRSGAQRDEHAAMVELRHAYVRTREATRRIVEVRGVIVAHRQRAPHAVSGVEQAIPGSTDLGYDRVPARFGPELAAVISW